jgi:peroxiredoxin
LSVGDTFPSFEAPDQLGRLVSSNELSSGKGSALLIVPPSAEGAARPAYEWAARNGNLLAQRGVELVLLIPESPEEGARIAADQGLRLGLLSDHGSRIAAALGTTSGGSGRPARPHLYFLGPDGRIHYSVSGTGDVAQLLLAAESLPGARRQSAIPLFN